MITLLNTSIITAHGKYESTPLTLEEAQKMVFLPCYNCQNGCPVCAGWGVVDNFDSAIGHESTAEILSELLQVKVSVNRQNFIQPPNSKALVFKLNESAPEGCILSREEIEKIGYEFGLLSRTE
jgi:hypothetical protein